MSQRKFFISYRRHDSPSAAYLICKRLVQQFGADDVFFDTESIPLGIDFHHFLTEQVQSCQVLVAVVGRSWISIADEQGQQRLDKPDDFVRIEIEAALERDIPVVPVLVDWAEMPAAAQLPASLRQFARRNGFEIRPGAMFDQQLDLLVQRLEQTLHVTRPRHAAVVKKDKEVTPGKDARTARTEESSVGQPGSIITNSIGLKLAAIPAGAFWMGSPADEKGRFDNEGPQHEVRITRPFHLGIYPVTQEEYRQVVGDNPSHFSGDDRRPVETVTWFDAVKFCNRLSEREQLEPFYEVNGDNVRNIVGNGYRLPTEAEWEYACRAGTTSRWWFGDEESRLGDYAWFRDNSRSTTHSVGQKPANAWGLHDMHGNVWEWCWDWRAAYSADSAVDPQGPQSGTGRVLRGGSCYDDQRDCRSAFRFVNPPVDRVSVVGFRLARTYN